MDRREFLKTTSGAAALAATATAAVASEAAQDAAAIASPAVSTGARELRVAMAWPDNGRGFADSAHRLAQRIETLTDGRFRFRFVSGVTNGIDAVTRGEADLYHGSAHDHLNAHRAFAYFAGLPGDAGLGRHDTAAWLTAGGGQILWDDLAADHGFKPLLAGSSGQAGSLWSLKPVASIADVAGMKVYAGGLVRDVARAIGAEPVEVPASGIIAKMMAGEIDAVQWGGTLAASSLGLHKVAKYQTAYGFARFASLASISMAKPLWDGLCASDQALFAAAAAEEFQASVAEARAHDPVMRRVLETAHGVSFAPLPRDIKDAVSRVTDAVVAHVAGADRKAARINASYMMFKATVRGRHGRLLDAQVS